MKNALLSVLFLLIAPAFLLAQAVSINTDGSNPDPSAILDVKSADKGVLVPRMTTGQRTTIASPAAGLLVYDTDTKSFWFYSGTAWTNLTGGGTPATFIADMDGDTRVQTEKTPDDDVIRFDLAGTERMALRQNATGTLRLELIQGSGSVYVGEGSGEANLMGFGNAGFGYRTLYSSMFGSENTATGYRALYANTSGNNNTANGANALFSNTTGAHNTALGFSALYANTTGFSNVAIGKDALRSNTDRSNLVAVGDSALYNNGTGVSFSTQATNNTALGSKALFSNTVGSRNTANGAMALYSNTEGLWNTATGNIALYSNTTGFFNTANGHSALTNNTTGRFNTANGAQALTNNTTGEANTVIGFNALRTNLTGNRNTANGLEALYSLTSGDDNTAIGANALINVVQGDGNTALGVDTYGADTLNNASVIGYFASINTSNKVRIGNTAVSVIEGQVDWSFPSDARFKYNIHDDGVPGLAFLKKLRPVTYQFDTRKFDEHLMQNMPDSIRRERLEKQDYRAGSARVQTGFLAQEVERACRELNFEFSGLHVPESDVDNYSLAYGSFVPLLVKGVQEQQAEIESLKNREAENAGLRAQVAALKAQLETQKAQLDKITAALQTAGIGGE